MRHTIEIVADLGEIRNEHLYDALATGVDHHMDMIDHRINNGWDLDLSVEPPVEARTTYDFFRAMMHDEDVANRLFVSVEEYTIDEIRQLPSRDDPVDAEARTNRLEQLGALRGALVGAENEVLIDSTTDMLQRQAQRSEVVDFGVGVVGLVASGSGYENAANAVTINDVGELNGFSLGGIIFPVDFDELEQADQLAHLRRANARADALILLGAAERPDIFSKPIRDMSDTERGQIIEWIAGRGYDDDDQNALYGGTVTADVFRAGG